MSINELFNLIRAQKYDETSQFLREKDSKYLVTNLISKSSSLRSNGQMCRNFDPKINRIIENKYTETVWYSLRELWSNVVLLEKFLTEWKSTDPIYPGRRLRELRQFKEFFLIDLLGLKDYIFVFKDATERFSDIARVILENLSDFDLDNIVSNIMDYDLSDPYDKKKSPSKCSELQYLLDELKRYDIEFAQIIRDERDNHPQIVNALAPLFSQLLELQLRALIKKTKRDAPDVSKFVKKLSIVLSNKLKAVNAVLNYQVTT